MYDEVNVAPLEDIESAAKAHLRIEIDLGSIEDNGQGDKFIFGNPGGHRLFSKLDQMTRNIEILFSRDARVTEQIENCQQEIVSLKGQVGLLVQSSEGYLKIREKFLAVFERDIKGVDTRNSTAIREGNIRAYEGDAVADAALFDQYNRSDTPLYLELYGLEFRKVLELRSMYNINS